VPANWTDESAEPAAAPDAAAKPAAQVS